VLIRPAGPADVEALAAIHGRAWWHAYEDFLPYDQLDKWDQDDRRRIWTEVLAGSLGHEVLVATTADDTARGFITFGSARDEDRTEDGELSTLYVDPPAQGAGVGRLLHDTALERLRAAGHDHAVVWVYEENGHALAFYAQAGWVGDGEPRQDPEWTAPGVRLRKALTP
jgi:ribosomal protein S18 acetylase RimI-like enzyme